MRLLPALVAVGAARAAKECPATCKGKKKTCDDWASEASCAELETTWGCDCSGCACAADPSDDAAWTKDDEWATKDDEKWEDKDDEWATKEDDPDARGAGDCPATCYDATCDAWASKSTCAELEALGCDCAGCACDGESTDDDKDDAWSGKDGTSAPTAARTGGWSSREVGGRAYDVYVPAVRPSALAVFLHGAGGGAAVAADGEGKGHGPFPST